MKICLYSNLKLKFKDVNIFSIQIINNPDNNNWRRCTHIVSAAAKKAVIQLKLCEIN